MGPSSYVQGFIDHLEHYLGPVWRRFSPVRPEDERLFQVLSFPGAPFPDSVTITTAGLSGHVLPQPRKRSVRQELVACTRQEAAADLAAVVDLIGREVLASHRALLRGQVLGPAGPLVEGATVSAMVCATPWYWPEGFERFEAVKSAAVLLVWLVPVTAPEAELIRRQGVDTFEEIVSRADPDLLDLGRASIV